MKDLNCIFNMKMNEAIETKWGEINTQLVHELYCF